MEINRFIARLDVVKTTTSEEEYKGNVVEYWTYFRGISMPKALIFFQRLDLSILR
jgi:hypothetical protein